MMNNIISCLYAAEWTLEGFKDEAPPYQISLLAFSYFQQVYWEDFHKKREQFKRIALGLEKE